MVCILSFPIQGGGIVTASSFVDDWYRCYAKPWEIPIFAPVPAEQLIVIVSRLSSNQWFERRALCLNAKRVFDNRRSSCDRAPRGVKGDDETRIHSSEKLSKFECASHFSGSSTRFPRTRSAASALLRVAKNFLVKSCRRWKSCAACDL